jgi:hypothetical protein
VAARPLITTNQDGIPGRGATLPDADSQHHVEVSDEPPNDLDTCGISRRLRPLREHYEPAWTHREHRKMHQMLTTAIERFDRLCTDAT